MKLNYLKTVLNMVVIKLSFDENGLRCIQATYWYSWKWCVAFKGFVLHKSVDISKYRFITFSKWSSFGMKSASLRNGSKYQLWHILFFNKQESWPSFQFKEHKQPLVINHMRQNQSNRSIVKWIMNNLCVRTSESMWVLWERHKLNAAKV